MVTIDFDEGDWQKDISALRDSSAEFDILVAVERSRSGNGAHAWFFFETPIPAALARKFGTALLTHTMSKRHDITFRSYDRFFPNQDTIPKGGLGNLIALPLQKEARSAGNSEFIDGNFVSFDDQWAFLGLVKRLSENDLVLLLSRLSHGNELGVLKVDEEDTQKPWETVKIRLTHTDFPPEIEIVKANILFVPKQGIWQRALNRLKRLAAFKNPEFYKKQAMRMPTYDKPRIICCAGETSEYLCLPRGCEQDLITLFAEQEMPVTYVDKTNGGKSIEVEFNGSLMDEQPLALDSLLSHDMGILSGTTAFGKTVVAIKLIVVTKRVDDFKEKNTTALKGALDFLQGSGVNMVFRSNIHQKFAVIDTKIVWYGSINLLSFGSSEESIMGLESPTIANELIKATFYKADQNGTR